MLHVRLLGQFELRRDGDIVLLPSRPAQSLLAYLALSAGTAHRREKLAGLLWPNSDDDNARHSSRHALWRFRKAIQGDRGAAPCLLTDELAVFFNAGASPDDGSLDVCLVKYLSRLEVLRLLPKLYSGGLWPPGRRAVSLSRRSRRCGRGPPVLCQADGELVGELPTQVEILPGALRCVTGPLPGSSS